MIGLSHCNISYSEVHDRNETQNFRFFATAGGISLAAYTYVQVDCRS